MRRFYIPHTQIKDDMALITGTDAHHLRHVLRLRIADSLVLFDGTGAEYNARVTAFADEGVWAILLGPVGQTLESPLDLTLAQGFLKEKKMDDLVRQLTELGVSRWIPFMARRSVPTPDAGRLATRRERWQKISLEALKQCGRSRPMAIEGTVAFQKALELAEPFEPKLLFYEKSDQPPLKTKPAGRRVFIMVGPEGGFDPAELAAARQRGFLIVGMGPRILRAETAALTAAVLCQFVFGDLGKNFLTPAT